MYTASLFSWKQVKNTIMISQLLFTHRAFYLVKGRYKELFNNDWPSSEKYISRIIEYKNIHFVYPVLIHYPLAYLPEDQGQSSMLHVFINTIHALHMAVK